MDELTFEVLYDHVLRAYYLLYPTMWSFLPLNSPKKVAAYAPKILKAINLSRWMSTSYMPRTRDLSDSRRKLLEAWCNMPRPPAKKED